MFEKNIIGMLSRAIIPVAYDHEYLVNHRYDVTDDSSGALAFGHDPTTYEGHANIMMTSRQYCYA